MASRNRELWAPYEYFWLDNEIEQGFPIEDIALAHKRSIGAIKIKLNNRKKVKHPMDRSRTPWSAYEDTQLLKGQYLPINFIASIHLRSVRSIYTRLRQHTWHQMSLQGDNSENKYIPRSIREHNHEQ